jgi:hypothetical protein
MKLFGAGKPEHAMADRKEARRILDELPPQDLKAAEELAHWHESIGAAEGFKPEERVQRLAMIDEAAQPRLRKLAREYSAAARGARVQQNLLWARIHEYWRQAAQAYARCIDAKAPPAVLTAGLRALAQQLKWQQLRYGPVDAALWGLANRIFALAEARGVGEARQEYLRAALFSASSPDSLLLHELELAERLISELASGFALAKAPAAELPYWIDLGQAMAPARSKTPPQPSAGLRYLGPGAALGTLQSSMKGLEKSRQLPAQLKLGADVDPETLLAVMRHLALHWAPEPPERKHARRSVKTQLTIAHGFDGVLEALGGGGDSLDFGKPAAECWSVENVSAGGFGALAPQAKTDWLRVGALVAAQPDGASNWLVGTVRRLSKVSSQETRVGVQTLSHAPALSRFALPSAAQAHGVILPAPGAGSGEAAIALRAGVYAPGENLEASIGGKPHVYMPQGVAERGDDYEIVKFKAMIREA